MLSVTLRAIYHPTAALIMGVKVQIAKAAAVFGKMRKIWKKDNISLTVKTRLYEAIILSSFL